MKEPQRELDWVAQRDGCVPSQVFQKLRREIQADIDVRNPLLTESQRAGQKIKFHLEAESDSYFIVHRNGAGIVSYLPFRLNGSAIEVLDKKGNPIISATLALNDEGRCLL